MSLTLHSVNTQKYTESLLYTLRGSQNVTSLYSLNLDKTASVSGTILMLEFLCPLTLLFSSRVISLYGKFQCMIPNLNRQFWNGLTGKEYSGTIRDRNCYGCYYSILNYFCSFSCDITLLAYSY